MAANILWAVTAKNRVDRIVLVVAETAHAAACELSAEFGMAPSELMTRNGDAMGELIAHRARLVVDDLRVHFPEVREEPWQYERLVATLEKILGGRA